MVGIGSGLGSIRACFNRVTQCYLVFGLTDACGSSLKEPRTSVLTPPTKSIGKVLQECRTRYWADFKMFSLASKRNLTWWTRQYIFFFHLHRLASSSQSSCLSMLGAEVSSLRHQVQPCSASAVLSTSFLISCRFPLLSLAHWCLVALTTGRDLQGRVQDRIIFTVPREVVARKYLSREQIVKTSKRFVDILI